MPFALYEYDAAFTRFFSEAVRTLARARSPILSQIQFIETPGTVGSRVRDRQGMDVVLEPGHTSTEVTADLNAVRDGDYGQLYAALDEASDSMAEQLVGLFVETLNKVTEGTGNVVDAGGKPLSFEVIYETLEKLEFSINGDDELVMPQIVMHPDQYEKVKDLAPPTPEQQRMLDELKERKLEEALARRRRRRLS